jgi:purine-nucleoside phosphorylase
LIGKNFDEFGPRFPDMSEPYCPKMIALAKEIAIENVIKVSTGTYLGLTGPTLETPAEYKFVRVIGADAVGMSTVPEIIVARHMDIPCFAVSIITDLGVPGKIKKVSLADVIEVASRQEPKMTLILRELIARS